MEIAVAGYADPKDLAHLAKINGVGCVHIWNVPHADGVAVKLYRTAPTLAARWRQIWTAGFDVLLAWEHHNVADIAEHVEKLRHALGEIDDPDYAELTERAAGETAAMAITDQMVAAAKGVYDDENFTVSSELVRAMLVAAATTP